MIVNLLNNPRILYQTPDDEAQIAEPSIAGSNDSSGLIVLSQEGREILINKNSVPDVTKLLKQLS